MKEKELKNMSDLCENLRDEAGYYKNRVRELLKFKDSEEYKHLSSAEKFVITKQIPMLKDLYGFVSVRLELNNDDLPF